MVVALWPSESLTASTVYIRPDRFGMALRELVDGVKSCDGAASELGMEKLPLRVYLSSEEEESGADGDTRPEHEKKSKGASVAAVAISNVRTLFFMATPFFTEQLYSILYGILGGIQVLFSSEIKT